MIFGDWYAEMLIGVLCLKYSPGTYSHEAAIGRRVAWPMSFGSPNWEKLPQLEKKTLRAEVSSITATTIKHACVGQLPFVLEDWNLHNQRQTIFNSKGIPSLSQKNNTIVLISLYIAQIIVEKSFEINSFSMFCARYIFSCWGKSDSLWAGVE